MAGLMKKVNLRKRFDELQKSHAGDQITLERVTVPPHTQHGRGEDDVKPSSPETPLRRPPPPSLPDIAPGKKTGKVPYCLPSSAIALLQTMSEPPVGVMLSERPIPVGTIPAKGPTSGVQSIVARTSSMANRCSKNPAQQRVAEKVREQRSAAKASSSGVKTKVSHGPKDEDLAKHRDSSNDPGDKSGGSSGSKDQKEKKNGQLVVDSTLDFAYGNNGFYRRHLGRFVNSKGETPEVVEVDTIVRGADFETGWVITPGQNHGMASFSFVKYEHPVMNTINSVLNSIKGYYLYQANEKLMEMLPRNGMVNSSRLKSASGIINKYFPDLPNSLAQQTINHWVRMEHIHRCQCTESTDNVRTVGESTISVYDPGIMAASCETHVPLDFGEMVKVNAVDCEIADAYTVKRIYVVTAHGNATIDLTNPAVPEYPAFGQQQSQDASKRVQHTMFASFNGTRGNFTSYEVNARNATKAMKRLLAARVNEEELYANQLSLAAALSNRKFPRSMMPSADKPHRLNRGPVKTANLSWRGSRRVITPLSLETLRVRVEQDHSIIGTKLHNHQVEHVRVPSDYIDMVVSGFCRLQEKFNRTYIDTLLDGCNNGAHWLYYTAYKAFLETTEPFVAREEVSLIPHIKRKLRQEYVKGVLLHEDTDEMVRKLKGCVKRELAKVGKVPRLFVSYDAGSMYANELPEFAKMAMSREMFFGKGSLAENFSASIWIVSKPKDGFLQKVFDDMIDATSTRDHIHIIVYSDDMIMAGNLYGYQLGFNVDISSNDSSNNTLVFGLAASLLSNFSPDRAMGLVRQCMKPLYVPNPDDSSSWFKVLFHSAFEGSGTVLTTFLNNVASFTNSIGIIYELDKIYSQLVSDSPEADNLIASAIPKGCARSGHLVTVDLWCDSTMMCFEKSQFLKHSPALAYKLVNGDRQTVGWRPYLNFGCVLRSFGKIEGDLEAKHLGVDEATFRTMPWTDRANQFMSSVVRGHVHEGACQLWDALRNRFSMGYHTADRQNVASIVVSAEANSANQSPVDYTFYEDSLCVRYDLSPHEITDLCNQIKDWQLGRVVVCPALTAFYRMDYGM